jgi:ribosomal protein S18 acetylase RimI-like enzyme
MFPIRPAAPADAEALAELANRTFLDAFSAQNDPYDLQLYLGSVYRTDKQAEEIADPRMSTLVAEAEGRLAAFAQLRGSEVPECVGDPGAIELMRFYVDRRFHGQGLAGALMTAVLAESRRRGAGTIWLGVWEHNGRAKAFYLKCGFTDVGSHLFLLGTDPQTDRIMVRSLSE